MKLTGLVLAGTLCLPVAGWAADASTDTQTAPAATHRHKVKKAQALPPLPSGPQGPVPQIPLDSMPPVAPQVSYEDGLLTIVAPNSTLGDILRGVKKHTSADIEIPPTASERVVTRLGPGPAREVMAELLNGSRFNYVLLGSAEDANQLTRVVLVPKTSDTAGAPGDAEDKAAAKGEAASAAAVDNDPPDDAADDNPEPAAEAEPPQEQPAAKTPQQMLQEMQQRQMQMQQQGGPTPFPGRPGAFIPPPGQQQQQQQQ
jgi:hypothetical protein